MKIIPIENLRKGTPYLPEKLIITRSNMSVYLEILSIIADLFIVSSYLSIVIILLGVTGA
jgi:hypothetical protein